MSRIRSLATAFALVASVAPVCASAQPPDSPQQHLDRATKLLLNVSASPETETGRRIAVLQRDYSDLAATFLTNEQDKWRGKYTKVEDDFRSLLSMPALDSGLRHQIEDVHAEVQLFYTTTLGQSRDSNPVAHTGSDAGSATPVAPTAAAPQTPPPVPATTPVATPVASAPSGQRVAGSDDVTTALALLDRIARAIGDVRNEKESATVRAVGTSSSSPSSAKVTIDAAVIDEIRAEIAQIRLLLQPQGTSR